MIRDAIDDEEQQRRLRNRTCHLRCGIDDIWCCHMAGPCSCTTYGGGCIEYMGWQWQTNGKVLIVLLCFLYLLHATAAAVAF
jgi:hypothetical protein